MIPDEKLEDTPNARFLRLLREPDPDDRPTPPAAGVAARICVVRAHPADRSDAAPTYSVHVARVELVDGIEEVVAGVANPHAVAGKLSAAEAAAAELAGDADGLRFRYGSGWNAVVVNDCNGCELHRRPIPAAA